jgi:hypothetical protein
MARSGEKNPGAFMSHPILLAGFASALVRSKRAPPALPCIDRSASLCDAPTRATALTRSGNILHRHFLHVVSLAMKHRLGGLDRHADHGLRREGHGSRRRSRPPRRARSVPSATHGSMASTSDLAFGPIRISKCYDTSVCRHCVISFAHSKVHTGHKRGNS